MNQGFIVVSDTWMGSSLFYCETAQQAEELAFYERRQMIECADNAPDEEELAGMVSLEQFRAWPDGEEPDGLTYPELFDWIGDQQEPSND